MDHWQVGDVAIALQDADCGCGEHSIKQRGTYRVHAVKCPWWATSPEQVYLNVSAGHGHYYEHTLFRREQKSTLDVFKLAGAPAGTKRLEPTE